MFKLPFTAVLAASLIAFGAARTGLAQMNQGDDSGVKQALADYIDAFNHHDGAAVAAEFTEDVDRTTVRGEVTHGRAANEKSYAGLFSGMLKNAHRTATAKSVRFLTPGIAIVEADYVLSGRLTPTGGEQPPSKGILSLVMMKQGDKWLITSFHEMEIAAS